MAHGRARGDRGAVLTEYILLIGLIATVAITSVKALGATTSRQFSAAEAQLEGTGSVSAAAAVDDGSGGASGATDTTPATTTPGTTTPTTAAVTTTTPTTAAPTTTAAPVTTTTLAPVATQGSTQLTTPTTTRYGFYWWGTSQLIVDDNLGVPLSGARVTLQAKAYTRQWNGTYAWVTTTQTLTTDSDGSVAFTAGPYYSGSYTGAVTQTVVSVTAVTLPNGLAWDGDPSTITINSP